MFKKLICLSFALLMSYAFNQEFQTPIDLSFDAQNGLSPQIAFDSSGNGVCVWYNNNDTNFIIQAARTTDGGVTFSSLIDLSIIGQDAINPQIAFDNSGNGVCVWQRFNGTNTVIQAARTIDGGATFSTPIDISLAGQDAETPQITFDNSGNGVCVWSNTTNTMIQAAQTINGGATFLTPVDVSTAGKVADSPQISFDNSGNGVCVWHNATDNIIQAAQTINGGATFLTPIALSPAGKVAGSPQIAFDNSGNGVCVWLNATDNIIQAARTTNGGATFFSSIDLSIAEQFANSPQISFDNSGNGICVWEIFNATNWRIQAARTTNGGATFSSPIDLSIAGRDAVASQISFDNSGNGICVWVGSDGANNIIQAAQTTDGGATFSSPVDVSLAGRNANAPQIAFDPISGNGVCVWQRFNGIEGQIVQASSIAMPSPSATLSVSGSQFKINSLFQKDIVNKISWDSIPGAASYKVYDSNNALLFQGLELSYFDHGRKKGKTYEYFVTWINNLGVESARVAVLIP